MLHYRYSGSREKYYKDQFNEWADTKWNHSPVAVGWLDGRTNQAKRFQILLDIGVQRGDSVLDVGCGSGHIIDHLKIIGLKIHYTGIDTNKASIEKAQQVYSKETFIHRTLADMNETYDWGLASGVFNYEFPKFEMFKTVKKLLSQVNKGVAFNLLNSSRERSSNSYEVYQPEEIFSTFNRRGALCTIVQDYGIEDDFTVYIRKN